MTAAAEQRQEGRPCPYHIMILLPPLGAVLVIGIDVLRPGIVGESADQHAYAGPAPGALSGRETNTKHWCLLM
jgi:hypothetical protein